MRISDWSSDVCSSDLGEVIGLLNNDIEVITPDWLTEMVGHALRPEIGVVGAMLYYPNNTIQHGGVMLGIGGVAGHAYTGAPRGYPGHKHRAGLAQTLSAVTAACVVMRDRKSTRLTPVTNAHLVCRLLLEKKK